MAASCARDECMDVSTPRAHGGVPGAPDFGALGWKNARCAQHDLLLRVGKTTATATMVMLSGARPAVGRAQSKHLCIPPGLPRGFRARKAAQGLVTRQEDGPNRKDEPRLERPVGRLGETIAGTRCGEIIGCLVRKRRMHGCFDSARPRRGPRCARFWRIGVEKRALRST